MIYTIYSKSSGKVLRVLSGPPEFVQLNLADDEDAVEGEVPEAHIVVNGLPVPRPDEDLLAERLESAALDLRQRRDALLYATDWTQVPDAPVDRAAWAAYRQALRDLPGNTVDPLNPVWPEEPGS
jgi:hypothetical protein